MNKALAIATDENGNVTRTVYLKAADTGLAVVTRMESVAEAGIRFMAAMVVHTVVRMYPLHDDDKAEKKTISQELEKAIITHSKSNRDKVFGAAWIARLIQTSHKLANELANDFYKDGYKGVIVDVLTAKTVDTANDTVFNYLMAKTKGVNNLSAIVKIMNPPKKGGTAATGKASNNGGEKAAERANTKAAASIIGDAGKAIMSKLPKEKPAENASKLADSVAAGINTGAVDRKVFVKRSIGLIDDYALLMELAEFCQERAKKLESKSRSRASAAPDIRQAAAAQ